MAIQDQINRITNEVGTQSEIIANIKDTLSDLDDGLTAMSEEVSELVDMPEEVNLTTMTEGVAAANGEIVVQSELIEQIKKALQGKAGSGGAASEPEIVTVTTSANVTVTVCDIFREFVDNEKDIVMFKCINDKTSWVKRQTVLVLVTKTFNIAHVRCESADLYYNYIGSQYEGNINVGDRFEKIKVGEWW